MRGLFKREPGLWVVILLPLVIFSFEVLGLTRFAGVDHTKLNMPIKYFDVMAVRQGELPLWNPYIATGAPHMAEGEPGTFYILNLIDHLPGDFYYWYGLNIILHFMIAGLTCYALLRYKGVGIFSATIFSIFFQFAPFTLLHLAAVALFQVLAWIPLLILLFDMVLDGRKPLWNTFWGVFLTFQLICIGSQQLLFFAFLAMVFLGVSRAVIARDIRIALRGAMFLIAVTAGGAVLAALQLIPTLEFKAHTVRGVTLLPYFHAHGTWLDWNRLATMIFFPASDFADLEDAIGFGSSQVYIGLFPLLMVALAVWNRDTRRRAAPYLWASIFLLLFAFGWNFPPYRLLALIPPFSYFRFLGRTSVLFVLFSVVSGSIAFDMLLRERKRLTPLLRKALISTAVFVVLVFLTFFLTSQKAPARAYIFLAVNIVLIGAFYFAASKPGRGIAYAAIALVVVQLFMLFPYARMLSQKREGFFNAFELMDKIAADDEVELKRTMNGFKPWVVDPTGLTDLRFTSRDWIIDGMEGLAGTMRRVGCMHIYLPLHEMKWKEMIFDRLLCNTDNNPENIELQNRNICWYCGINYIAVESDYLDIPGFEPFEDEAVKNSYRPTARMFRNSNPYPRFFLTRNIRPYKLYDLWRFFNLLLDETPKEEFGVVIPDVQNPHVFPDRDWEVEGNVRVTRDGFNSYELEVLCERDCYLVVRDNYYPGMDIEGDLTNYEYYTEWEVEVDGELSFIYMADYINRAVYLEKGTHIVEFFYRPDGFRSGLRISIIAMLVFIFAGVGLKWGLKL